MGIFNRTKKEEEEEKKVIPRERLRFYSSSLKKKESYTSHVVSCMPFDSKDIEGLTGDKMWERLTEMSVEYLKETKELPSFAKTQDYERSGGASYVAFSTLEELAEELETPSAKDAKPITLFNNAFDKIVLPAGFREKIIETVSQLKDHKKIFEDWGLGEKVNRGKGINILFSGESGTGKTWCGEVIAEYLGTKAEIISVASIESKWVGESEQNVSAMFRALNGGNKVLILDEVDSFLTSRSLSDSSPHYNKLTNQFLIELERHNGIVVMTTNRSVKLDRALHRRIDLVLDFPFPDEAGRQAIWKYMIPEKMPTSGLNIEKLAVYPLNGGQIKNAVFSAARKAVTRDSKVTQSLLEESCKEEQVESHGLSTGKDHS